MDIQRSGAAILANPDSKMASLRQMNMPWFQTPFFKTLLEEADLAEDDKKLVATYAQDGYLIIDAKIPELDSFCERLIAALAPLYRGHGRIQDAWKENTVVIAQGKVNDRDGVLKLLCDKVTPLTVRA